MTQESKINLMLLILTELAGAGWYTFHPPEIFSYSK